MLRSRQHVEMGRGAGKGWASACRTIVGPRMVAVALAGLNRSMIVDTIEAASSNPNSKVAIIIKFLNGERTKGNPKLSARARRN